MKRSTAKTRPRLAEVRAGLLAGDLDRLIEPLVEHDQAERMAQVGAGGGRDMTDGKRS